MFARSGITLQKKFFINKTKILVIFSIALILQNVCLIQCDPVSDLTKLINDEVAASLVYKLPTDNSHIYKESTDSVKDSGIYNYIIVGAGSAGAVLAKRLSERPFRKVLLIEAGDEQNTYTDIPGCFTTLQTSKYNWGYFTTSQTHACQGMINKQCSYPRGQGMGGTSAINALMYVRSSPYDHELWTKSGVTGWTWNDALYYYRKLESYWFEGWLASFGYHGLTGPVSIEKSTPAIPFVVDYFLKANEEFYRTTKDYNGQFKMGAGPTQYTKKNGKRVSSNRAYLNKPTSRLTILKKAYVHKIVIKDNVAVGVEFMQNGIKYIATAKNEVIISAGAINSPQLLMLSGIGPAEELKKHGIPIIKALPAVGQNLEDHIGFVGLQFESDVLLTNSSTPLEEHVREYLQQSKGRLTESGLSSIVFYSTESGADPDIEFILSPLSRAITRPGNIFNLNAESAQTFTLPPAIIDRVFRIIIMLLHPKSKGSVTLRNSNPKDFPNIDPNSLSDAAQDDLRRIYEAIKYVEALLSTPTMTSINAKLLKQVLPACADFVYKSKDFWYCTIKHMSHTIYHPTGSCRMGEDIANSVVNSRLRVHGIKKLRVADASVIPFEVSCHTNGPTMMIGEKAAEMIFWDNLFVS